MPPSIKGGKASGKAARRPSNKDQQTANAMYREFEPPSRPARPSPLTASGIPDMPLDLVHRIRSFPLFSSAPETFLMAIGSRLRPQVYLPQENILTEGSEAKVMYFLVRGSVAVTSLDTETTYAELHSGSFFGEIGILMDMPRTASVVAKQKTLVVRLNKEDLRAELPNFPEVEKTIRDEATERLAILERKKAPPQSPSIDKKRLADNDVPTGATKKRKSPTASVVDVAASNSALGSGTLHIRQLLTKFPLFADLSSEDLHFLGLNAQPQTYPPFTDIITQGSSGREVYFICTGEVEVLGSKNDVKARLGEHKFFGEVTSLSLAPQRTATVRSVNSVECLVVSGQTLDELWRRCPPKLKSRVEATARQRLNDRGSKNSKHDAGDTSLAMDGLVIDAGKRQTPKITQRPASPSKASDVQQSGPQLEPLDHDPFGAERSNRRWDQSRRGSLVHNIPLDASPLAKGAPMKHQLTLPLAPKSSPHSSQPSSLPPSPTPASSFLWSKVPSRRPSYVPSDSLPDRILLSIFRNLDIGQLMILRRVSTHWCELISFSDDVLPRCDLSLFNRKIDDHVILQHIAPFLRERPRSVNISNCYHVSDEGFTALMAGCGPNVKTLKMKSVWEISPPAVAEMTDKMPHLEEIDLSNCRKVSDGLLARIITGWNPVNGARKEDSTAGCPKLRKLSLSYCKHITDQTMYFLKHSVAGRLEYLDLTRCTTISDLGFRYWSDRPFPRLRKLILADCTYLSDNAMFYLVHAARGLKELDLSFCCALSDHAIEILAKGFRELESLDVAFCGSAVSDNSLYYIAFHLRELKVLSVRGCVRVTVQGVEAILNGCPKLKRLDVSQCRNLQPWFEAGGPKMKPNVHVNTVADGKWRTVE